MDAIIKVFLCVVVFGFVMCSEPHETVAKDVVSLGDSLTAAQTIISKGGNFELGFFKPGKPDNYYVGIWYKKYLNAPIIHSSSSKLAILDGNLVLFFNNGSMTIIWSTSLASNTLNSPEVVLGDDGNLVLREKSNPSVVIWQSFDYPTDTCLSCGKLGFHKKTNQSQKLTSWRNQEDPATGFYNLVSNAGQSGNSQYVISWNNAEPYWNSGEWDENSKTFLLWNLFWSKPEQPCGVYGICGPFGDCNQTTSKCQCLPGFVPRFSADGSLQDSTFGCVRSMPLKCGSKFDTCEDTCSCNAYAFDHGCQLWDGDIMNSNQFTSQRRPATFYLRHAATEISSPLPKVRKRNVLVWKIVVPVSILVATIMGVLGYMYLFKRNKANKRGRLKGLQGVLTSFL
ncbi:hypothetical protein MKX01_014525 [Papaver californicum]|nr:hypothetical protein MKX01_014525 [Papaver californicum]